MISFHYLRAVEANKSGKACVYICNWIVGQQIVAKSHNDFKRKIHSFLANYSNKESAIRQWEMGTSQVLIIFEDGNVLRVDFEEEVEKYNWMLEGF